MNAKLQLTEEFSAGAARLRVDVYGGEPREHVLDDLTFLNYRLADVRISPEVTLADADIVWNQDGDKSVSYDGRAVTFTGPWPAGPIQKVIVAVLALRMEAVGLHPSHSAAVNYRGKTLLFLGGESNHGKSMGLIEAGVRGALQVASETTVIDEQGRAAMGSVDTPNKGVEKFWGEMPSWGMFEGTPNIDIVIVPAIDGNFDPATNGLIPFERQFQFLHSLQNYFLTNELLAPGHVMPMVDNDVLRAKRADFVSRFCGRPFFFIRAATPQVLMDEVDTIL
jgi:hypothetical protein